MCEHNLFEFANQAIAFPMRFTLTMTVASLLTLQSRRLHSRRCTFGTGSLFPAAPLRLQS